MHTQKRCPHPHTRTDPQLPTARLHSGTTGPPSARGSRSHPARKRSARFRSRSPVQLPTKPHPHSRRLPQHPQSRCPAIQRAHRSDGRARSRALPGSSMYPKKRRQHPCRSSALQIPHTAQRRHTRRLPARRGSRSRRTAVRPCRYHWRRPARLPLFQPSRRLPAGCRSLLLPLHPRRRSHRSYGPLQSFHTGCCRPHPEW